MFIFLPYYNAIKSYNKIDKTISQSNMNTPKFTKSIDTYTHELKPSLSYKKQSEINKEKALTP